MSQEPDRHPFISYLESKCEDRAIMAALRRGLGQPPGSVPAMFPYVVPFVHKGMHPWQEEVHYMVASLFGFYPQSTQQGNMGTHFAHVQRADPENKGAERRFVALMAAHPEDLAFQLRQAVSLLKSKDVLVNWHRLMKDVLSWSHPEARIWVHRQWAGEFWGTSPEPTNQETDTNSQSDQL